MPKAAVLPGSKRADGAGLDLGRGGESHLLDGPRDGDRQLDVAEAMGTLRRQDGGHQRR